MTSNWVLLRSRAAVTHSQLFIRKHTLTCQRETDTVLLELTLMLCYQMSQTLWVHGHKNKQTKTRPPQIPEPAPIIHLKEPTCLWANMSNMWSKYCRGEGCVTPHVTACHKEFLFDCPMYQLIFRINIKYTSLYRLITASNVTNLLHTISIQPSAENGYLCVKAENQYATIFHFTNPFSPSTEQMACKRKKKVCQPVIICAINGAGYVPVEWLQMVWW